MKTKPKTDKQVVAEIAALRKIKPKVRIRSMFGDNHHHAIEAQIYVLENKLPEAKVISRYEPDESIEEGEQERNVFEAAMDAVAWRDGEREDGLVDEWKELVVK